MKRFRGGIVFKAHRLLYHSTLGLRVIKKKKKIKPVLRRVPQARSPSQLSRGTAPVGRGWGLGFPQALCGGGAPESLRSASAVCCITHTLSVSIIAWSSACDPGPFRTGINSGIIRQYGIVVFWTPIPLRLDYRVKQRLGVGGFRG